MDINELLGEFDSQTMTEYEIFVCDWPSEIPFCDWCREVVEAERYGSVYGGLFDWAQGHKQVVSDYVNAVGYPPVWEFDLYDFLEMAHCWHVQTQLLDEYQVFAKYATLSYLRSLGINKMDEYDLEELLNLVYQEQSSVTLKDIKECYEQCVETGLIEDPLTTREDGDAKGDA